MELKKLFRILIAAIILSGTIKAQSTDPPFLKYMNHPWVDSVLNTLTIEQRIAQCIWIAGYSNRGIEHEVDVSDIILMKKAFNNPKNYDSKYDTNSDGKIDITDILNIKTGFMKKESWR